MILLSIQGLILLAASVQGAHGWKVCAINDPAYSRSCNKEDCTAGVRAAIKDCFGGGTILVSKSLLSRTLSQNSPMPLLRSSAHHPACKGYLAA